MDELRYVHGPAGLSPKIESYTMPLLVWDIQWNQTGIVITSTKNE